MHVARSGNQTAVERVRLLKYQKRALILLMAALALMIIIARKNRDLSHPEVMTTILLALTLATFVSLVMMAVTLWSLKDWRVVVDIRKVDGSVVRIYVREADATGTDRNDDELIDLHDRIGNTVEAWKVDRRERLGLPAVNKK